jgi:hypothetical protein
MIEGNMKQEYKAIYKVPIGQYESDSLVGLIVEVLKHRFFHLWYHKRWMD